MTLVFFKQAFIEIASKTFEVEQLLLNSIFLILTNVGIILSKLN